MVSDVTESRLEIGEIVNYEADCRKWKCDTVANLMNEVILYGLTGIRMSFLRIIFGRKQFFLLSLIEL